MRRGAVALAVAVMLPASVACDEADEPAPKPALPSLTPVACPPAVDDVLMSGYSCATLTTGGGDGRTPVRLLVTTIQPTDEAQPDPLIVVGEDFATTLNYAGLAPAADRLHRTLVLLNPRGAAGSDPDLSCPEVDELGPVAPAGGVDAWVDAVGACRDRLEDAGVDLTEFGEEQMAHDVLDLVEALGVSTWNIGSWGSSGRVALDVLRLDPKGLRSVFLDAPELPGDDSLGTAALRTSVALTQVLEACADEKACRRLPHDTGDVERIAAALDSDPLEVEVASDTGPVDVSVDGHLLVRMLRHMLSNNGSVGQFESAGAVPAALAAAQDREAASLATLLEPLMASAPYCEGYVPTCTAYHRISLGAYLATVCGRLGTSDTGPDLLEVVRRTFGDDDPYRAACADWPSSSAPDAADPPIVSDVPVLLMNGAWDPYVDPAPRTRLQSELAGLSRLTMVEMPGRGHNVLGQGDCAQALRNGFVADPEKPVDQSCLAEVPKSPNFLTHIGD